MYCCCAGSSCRAEARESEGDSLPCSHAQLEGSSGFHHMARPCCPLQGQLTVPQTCFDQNVTSTESVTHSQGVGIGRWAIAQQRLTPGAETQPANVHLWVHGYSQLLEGTQTPLKQCNDAIAPRNKHLCLHAHTHVSLPVFTVRSQELTLVCCHMYVRWQHVRIYMTMICG